MSEITKLYENANIEKEVIKGCYDYYSKLGIDIWKENDCRGKNCDTCKKDKSIKRYPPFTAEKQISIIKLISKQGQVIIENWEKDNRGFNVTFRANSNLRYITIDCITRKTVEEALAKIVNDIWQDLTEAEKQQVKGILE